MLKTLFLQHQPAVSGSISGFRPAASAASCRRRFGAAAEISREVSWGIVAPSSGSTLHLETDRLEGTPGNAERALNFATLFTGTGCFLLLLLGVPSLHALQPTLLHQLRWSPDAPPPPKPNDGSRPPDAPNCWVLADWIDGGRSNQAHRFLEQLPTRARTLPSKRLLLQSVA